MRIISAVQGSAEWHAARATHFTASQAPAMAGVSKYQTRSELLQEKYTGVVPDVSEQQQRLFDRGHAAEAAARPIAEDIIGDELYPVTGESEEHPHLLASLDGMTLLGDVIFEHKLYNQALVDTIKAGDELPEHYRVQMDQQLLVSGAEKCLFMCSDGSGEPDRGAWCWYYPNLTRFDQLLAGWAQFIADLDAYQPKARAVESQGEGIGQLPKLYIELSGAVQHSNLPDFKASALAIIESIKTELVTDKDFADAEQIAKDLERGEKQLKQAKQNALEQTVSIDELFRTVDELQESMRQKRLHLQKLVKAEKDNRRAQIQRNAEEAFASWLADAVQQAGLPPSVRVQCSIDVAGAMKGKRTINSLESAADDEVARAKIEAQREVERLAGNHQLLTAEGEGYESLFADRVELIQKAADDLTATIRARIADHQERERRQREQAEQAREAEQSRHQADAYRQASATQAPFTYLEKPEVHTPAEARSQLSQQQRDTVTIARSEYDALLRDRARLNALLSAGVDNWDGYADAMEEAEALAV